MELDFTVGAAVGDTLGTLLGLALGDDVGFGLGIADLMARATGACEGKLDGTLAFKAFNTSPRARNTASILP